MRYFSIKPAHLRLLGLVGLAMLLLIRIPFSAAHTDLAHDLFVAWQLDHGIAIPWSGRPLAGTIHLGPFYYWLLGALIFLSGGSWLGTSLLLGALAATQVPLAYLVGKEAHSRRAGLIWAVLILAPSWTSLEWVFPGHNLLTPTFALAYLLCILRFVRKPRFRYLCGIVLAFVLGLHAHPTMIGLLWTGIGVIIWTVFRRRLILRQLFSASVIGLLPLLPYFVWDGLNGFADFRAGAAYLGDDGKVGHLALAAPILWATLSGGPEYWLGTMLNWQAWAVRPLELIAFALGLLVLFGLWKSILARNSRAVLVSGLLTALAILLTTALIRGFTPYYMTTVLYVVLTGLIAFGLAEIEDGYVVAKGRTFVLLATVSLTALCTFATASYAARGNWPFAFYPMFDVTGLAQPSKATMFLPAYAIARSGRFLCEQEKPTVHGIYGRHLLYDYGMDTRFACGLSETMVGGSDPARSHWLGLSRSTIDILGIHPAKRFGPLAVVPAIPVTHNAIAIPTTPVYPPYSPVLTNNLESKTFEISMHAGQYLVISNFAYFSPDPQITVSQAGKAIQPITSDAASWIYGCDGCKVDAATDTIVSVKSIDLSDVDIVLM